MSIMLIQELGRAVRDGRNARGLTQAALAAEAGLSLNTLNRLENGVFPDLGIKKAGAILEKLGMELSVNPIDLKKSKPDFVSMACTSAGVSFRKHSRSSTLPTPQSFVQKPGPSAAARCSCGATAIA